MHVCDGHGAVDADVAHVGVRAGPVAPVEVGEAAEGGEFGARVVAAPGLFGFGFGVVEILADYCWGGLVGWEWRELRLVVCSVTYSRRLCWW